MVKNIGLWLDLSFDILLSSDGMFGNTEIRLRCK